MKKIIVLGAGMVGKAIAADLCRDFEVSCADINKEALKALSEKYPVSVLEADLSNPQKIKEIITPFALVIGAVPGFMGFKTLQTIIECGKDVVDISFFPEDTFALDELAKQHNVTAVVDCGVAPGMSNLILGYHNESMQVEAFECLVGGLPVIRSFPYQYKAPFSPVDVIEEYIRPARYVENGQLVIRPALSDAELVNFEETGTLESFNSDGLRTLAKTMSHIPNMKEKTLRYPGHIDYMKVLRETGFFDKTPVNINGVEIRPVDFTSKLLFPVWKLKEGEKEFTIMRITISGKENEKNVRYVYTLYDRYDDFTETSSMARTTGYTCTAAARLVIEKKFTRKGISPPEYIGMQKECFAFVMDYMEQHGITYHQKAER